MLITADVPPDQAFREGASDKPKKNHTNEEEKKRENSSNECEEPYVPKQHWKPSTRGKRSDTGISSAARRLAYTVKENKYLLTILGAGTLFLGGQFIVTRDSAQQQPLIDKHQNYQIDQNAHSLEKLNGKMDAMRADIIKEIQRFAAKALHAP